MFTIVFQDKKTGFHDRISHISQMWMDYENNKKYVCLMIVDTSFVGGERILKIPFINLIIDRIEMEITS